MKKLVLFLIFGFFIMMAANVSAADCDTKDFNSCTKEEAISYIEKSLSDPQISEWVSKKFHSENLFMMAIKLAPEKTVKEAAISFSDFQQVGGEEGKPFPWMLIVAMILAVFALALAISMA